jgi:hypothetical protein
MQKIDLTLYHRQCSDCRKTRPIPLPTHSFTFSCPCTTKTIIARNVANPPSQKSLAFVWRPDLLSPWSSWSTGRGGGEAGMTGARGMGNTRISPSTGPSRLAGAGGLGAGVKCSDCGDTVPIAGDCTLSGVIGCTWACVYAGPCSITVSTSFDSEFGREAPSPKYYIVWLPKFNPIISQARQA